VSLAIAACWLVPVAFAQPPVEPKRNNAPKPAANASPEADKLREAERHVGTMAAGIGLVIVGLTAIGRAVWIVRPAFRGDSTIHKVGVVGLVVAGVMLIGAGMGLARAGSRGVPVDKWLNQQG
jgi:hypothetical protein